MTKVNESRLEVIEHVFRELEYQQDWICRLDKRSNILDRSKPIEWRVNWSCIGATSSESARKAAEQLEVTANLVDMLNSLEIIEDRNDDPVIKDRESYYKYVDIMLKYIPVGDIGIVKYFLTGEL